MTAPNTAESPMEQHRVLVVDDQHVIRAGLTMIIDNEPDLVVVGDASNGLEAIAQVKATRPDVVLMDVRMPELDGLEATMRILSDTSSPPPAILVLTTFEDDEYVFGALRAGASGFLLKDATPDALVGAVRTLAHGEALVDPSVTRRLVQRWAELEGHATVASSAPVLPELTERETQTLIALAGGGSNRDLAAELFLSEATVKTHVSSLLAKLGVSSRVQAVILAYERGVVRPGADRTAGPGSTSG